MGSPIVFFLLAFVTVAAEVGIVPSASALHSGLFFVFTVASIAVFFLILSAPFIAMVQITVYAGAIMVLFLFVIMLLGAERLHDPRREGANWQPWVAGVLALALLGSFFLGVLPSLNNTAGQRMPTLEAGPEAIGLSLFGNYVFPFEVTSVLLLVAMIGVVVWQSRKKEE